MSAPRFARFLRFFSGKAASEQQIGTAPAATRLLDREIARIPKISLGPRLSIFVLVVKNSFLIVAGYTASYNGTRWVVDQLFPKRIRAKEEAKRFDSFHFKDKSQDESHVIMGEKESPELAVVTAELKTGSAELKRKLNTLEEDMIKLKERFDSFDFKDKSHVIMGEKESPELAVATAELKSGSAEFKRKLNTLEEDMIKVKKRLIECEGEQMSILERRTWSVMEIAAIAAVAVATWFGSCRGKSS